MSSNNEEIKNTSTNTSTDPSVGFGFAFYTFALLVWSIYDYFANGRAGMAMVILIIGLLIFYISRQQYSKKQTKK